MQIDWFTFVAQIVNFLIILYLLRRFLYVPIVAAMEQRQEDIAAQFAAAEARAAEAAAEAETLRAQQTELANQRDALLHKAVQQVEARRHTMVLEARAEVEEMQHRWYDAVERERAAMLHALRMRLGEQISRISRQALADLAGADLERAMVERVVQQIGELTDEVDGLAWEQNAQPIRIRSAFPLDEDLQKRLQQALAELTSDDANPGLEFMLDEQIVCGLEIELPYRRLGWNLRDYLQALDSDLVDALRAHPAAAASPIGDRETPLAETARS